MNECKKHYKFYKHYSLKFTFIIPNDDAETRNQKESDW